MEKLPTLHFLPLNQDQKDLIISIINHFGTAQHPICNNTTIDGFMVSYLKEIINSKKFKKSISNLSENGKRILAEIEEIIYLNQKNTMKTKTNWSSPKTNIFAGINDLRKCFASGYKARLVRARNEDCQHPITEKAYPNDFRSYEFSIGYISNVNKIKSEEIMYNEFEKSLSLNYINCYGTTEAKNRYYQTGILSKDNFHTQGCSHLVHVDDYIKFLEKSGDLDRAQMYKKQYRIPEYGNTAHFFDFYRLKNGYHDWNVKKFKRKLWVVEMLNEKEPQPQISIMMKTIIKIINVLVYPLKYIPQRSVLRMKEYNVHTFRVGDVTNGFCVEFHIPKKFSFK
jgi:hypothetical protein